MRTTNIPELKRRVQELWQHQHYEEATDMIADSFFDDSAQWTTFLEELGYQDNQNILNVLKTRVRETAKRLSPYQSDAYDTLDIQRATYRIDAIEEMTHPNLAVSTLPFDISSGYMNAQRVPQDGIMAIIDAAHRADTKEE